MPTFSRHHGSAAIQEMVAQASSSSCVYSSSMTPFAIAVAAHIDAKAGRAGLRKVGMGESIFCRCAIALCVGKEFQDSVDGSIIPFCSHQIRADKRELSGMTIPSSRILTMSKIFLLPLTCVFCPYEKLLPKDRLQDAKRWGSGRHRSRIGSYFDQG